jgi:hypothetical protein
VKKLFGENDVEMVLHRLDRLTLDESRATAAQTLEVVHGLVKNQREVMSGERVLLCLPCALCRMPIWLDREASTYDIQKALGLFIL